MVIYTSFLCPIAQRAIVIPDQIAIDSPDGHLTYKQLDHAIHNYCKQLQTQHVVSGMHCAFLAPPTLSTILLILSLIRLKAIACPLSTRIPAQQIPSVMIDCGATLFLDPYPICIKDPSAPFDATLNTNQLATILMTSGSTHRPKAACHTIGNHIASAKAAIEQLKCNTSSRWLLSLPLFHIGGIAILFRCALAGATVVIDQTNFATTLIEKKITHASFVPTQLYRLLQEPLDQIEQIKNTIQCLLIGGAPLTISLAKKGLDLHLPLFPSYGMTEMSSIITLAHPDQIQDNLHMGSPLYENALTCAIDREIIVSGPTLFQGYWNSSKCLCIDRFYTKDLGKVDPNGHLILLGRKDRMFISGGENIQPEEIETILGTIPGILAAHVAPIPDVEFGMRPCAYLLLESQYNYTVDSLKTLLNLHLPSFKHPVRILPFTQLAHPSNLKMAALDRP